MDVVSYRDPLNPIPETIWYTPAGSRPLRRCFTWKEEPGSGGVGLFRLVLRLAIERFLCFNHFRRKFELELAKTPRCQQQLFLEELPKAYTYDRLMLSRVDD